MDICERMKQNHCLQKNVKSFFWRRLQQKEGDYVETSGNVPSAFEMKWNDPKKNYITKAFTNMYPKAKTSLVQPTNFAEFCYLD
jgi:hypothetical protein